MSLDLGTLFRSEKRQMRRELQKRGYTPEQIDYALFCRDNAQKAMELFKKCVNDMADLGTKIISKMHYGDDGVRPEVTLTGMTWEDKQQRDALLAAIEAQKKEIEKKKSELDKDKATDEENKTVEKIDKKILTS